MLEDSIRLQLIYFLTTTAFWLKKYPFRIHMDNLRVLPIYFTLCDISSLQKIHGIAYINFDHFTIDESNQVKVPPKIMLYQGHFSKLFWGRDWKNMWWIFANTKIFCRTLLNICALEFAIYLFRSQNNIFTHHLVYLVHFLFLLI